MPPPRRSSPRRKDRRSRSRSPSRERRRSRSPREKRRSRSPYKKRSRSRERGSSPKRRSPERSSPARRKSLGTKRRSSSPHGYDQPVKRQADSTRRTYRSKSRSHSPVPQKKSRDSRRDDSPPEKVSSRRRSPSPLHSSKYSDHPSSSKSSDRRSSKKDEIDFVKIVDMGSKLPKLNKRFQTLEQLAQGGFEFEENITIGIHRGPSHLDLDEDVPVNYDFNPKLFIMLHPKKDYTIPVFERDEILAFHHDDVLDEEAYVEKRTITVKPSDKPKPTTSRSDNSRYKDIDYKITIGSSRESHGDRRMVHDSGSRSSRYDPEVKIRLDARPDPKYERLYKESRRQEERDLLDDNIQRNPSDLRYNLMRKKSSDDDRDRDRSRGRESYGDARARIEAKRKALSDRYDGSRDQSPPPTRLEKRKIGIKTELPDFKNRPDDEKPSTSDSFSKFHRWGYCEICNVPINSEKQAIEHVQGTKHIEAENEKKHGTDGRSNERKPTALFINGKRVLDGDEESIDPRFNRKNTYNNDDKFQEDWVTNPEITPKGASYYEHDNRSRDDMTFWERKQMFQRTGRYPEKVSLRDRGIRRGRGRDIRRNPVFRPPPRGPRTPAMDDWKHDKFAEVEKGDKSADGDGDVVTRYKIDRRKNKDKESSDKKKKSDSVNKRERDIKKEEAALSKDSNISVTAD